MIADGSTPRCRQRQARWRYRGARHAIALLGLLVVIAMPAMAQRPPRVIPSSGDEVVARLPRGYSALEPVATTVANPFATREAALQRARRLLESASMTGDTRLAARAEALLSRQSAGDDGPGSLGLRAYAAQHRHDFAQSLRLLDRLIALQPRDAGARLARAEIHLVQGKIHQARNDCRALALGVDADAGLTCAALVALRTGEYPLAKGMLDRVLAFSGPGDARRPHALLARAEVAARARDADADARFRQALAARPGDIRVRVSYARYLRQSGRGAEVERLLEGSEQSDTAQLQRALSAVAARRRDAGALVAAQARRYALARKMGSEPELRDEAEFLLVLQRRPREALALALRNFEQQRDHEDVDILVRAARASGEPSALQGLHAWQREQGLTLAPEWPVVPLAATGAGK